MTVPAVGGTRLVPEPDPIARDYLLLALRLDAHAPGLVDGYAGPAELKATVDLEQLRSPARLRDDARALLDRLDAEVTAPDRRSWLAGQLVALETQAAILAGDDVPYEVAVERYLGFEPIHRDDELFAAARATVDELLPGDGSVSERLEAWDRTMVIPTERLEASIAWLIERLRDRADRAFGLPAGEDLRVRLVAGQPWGAYCWFDGGGRSRIDVNTDLPARAPALLRTIAHEAYPGHHLEHAWKEATLVDGLGRLEASVLLINTPECPISEGLADLGFSVLLEAEERTAWLAELLVRAVEGFSDDGPAAMDAATRAAALAPARSMLDAIGGRAARLRHADGWTSDDVLAFLIDVGGMSPAGAAKRLEFIEHPLWRTYIHVYSDGEALLRRWVDLVEPGGRVARFGRLLREQLGPSAILADLDAG